MKIFISVLSVNEIGGISTSLINFLNYLRHDNEVDLCVLCNYISPKVCIPDGINIIQGVSILEDCYIERSKLKNQSVFRRLMRNIIRLFRRVLGLQTILDYALRSFFIDKEYDISIAFTNDQYDKKGHLWVGGCYDLVKNRVNSKHKIAWIHNDAIKCGFTPEISKKIFAEFDSIVHVSYDNKAIFDEIAPIFKEKSYVVYNFYDIENIYIKSKEISNPYSTNGKLHFVTVCRLYEEQKKVSRILETVDKLNKEGVNTFDWTIVGSGKDLGSYLHFINENELYDIVKFVGLKKNPYPYMLNADAFVLSSQYEGFGMTIKEAQILGTPTFVTEFGPAHEAVIHGKQGEICENSSSGVYSMIKRILDNPSLLVAYKKYLKENQVNNDMAIKQFNILAQQR